MRKFTTLVLFTTILSFGGSVFCYAQSVDNKTEEVNYEKIINQFHEYVAKLKPEVRSEIDQWRQAIKGLNAQKKDLYKALSKEGKDFLQEEREFKKKLIIKKKESQLMQDANSVKQEKDSQPEQTTPEQSASSKPQEPQPSVNIKTDTKETKAK